MANLFPTAVVQESTIQDEAADLTKFGRSWKFNYETGDFETTATGKVIEADGFESWVEWCQKAVKTVRYKHLIYSTDFGQEFEDLIGRGLNRAANESEIQRMVTECLMVNPRTAAVEDFSFEWDKDKVTYTCTIYNIRDESRDFTGEAVIT